VRDFAIAGYHGYSWCIYNDDWSYIHWVRTEGADRMGKDFYAASVDSSHLRATGGKGMFDGIVKAYAEIQKKEEGENTLAGNESQAKYKDAATLDGEAQWTCTPGSVAEVPDTDELYDRRNDPFQLHNVLSEHPDVAKKLLGELSTYLQDLLDE